MPASAGAAPGGPEIYQDGHLYKLYHKPRKNDKINATQKEARNGGTYDKREPREQGDTVRYVSKVVSSGRTSVVSHIQVSVEDSEVLEGFITFVSVLAARARALPR